MQGRIKKRNNILLCIINTKEYTLKMSNGLKFSNGDLVYLNKNLFNAKSSSIDGSKLIIEKKNNKNCLALDLNSDTKINVRLKNRIIDLRRPINQEIFFFRSEIKNILRKFFNHHDFLNVDTPTIVGSFVEGRVKTFEINFYESLASLTMTKLVHLRYLICSDFKNVYDLSPVFVQGEHKTHDHVSEYYTLDWATSKKMTFDKALKFCVSALRDLILNLPDPLLFKKINYKKKSLLEQIRKVKILSYDDLISVYIEKNPNEGDFIKQYHLPKKVIQFAHSKWGNCIWVKDFPEQFKQFYCDTTMNGEKKYVLSSELWWNSIKIGSTCFSSNDYQKTKERLINLGLNIKSFETYLNALKYASSESYLGSLYIERIIMLILNISDIRETIMFPRSKSGTFLEP